MRTVIVQPGDTIHALAVRHLGDASAWRELVRLNALDYPYVSPDPSAWRARGRRVLTSGDALLAPARAGAPAPAPGPSSGVSAAAEAAYGVDVGWHDRRLELLMEGARPGTDRALINLAKALYRRLITKPGELPAHPEYGCRVHRHVGQPASLWRARLAALDVVSALTADPRVRSATAQAEYTPDERLVVTAQVTPVPPSETTLNLTVTFTLGGAHVDA